MSKVQTLRVFINQRLTAAAEEIFELFERTIAEYEEELCGQRKLLDAVFQPEVRIHRADVQRLLVSKEEDPPEQQDWSPSLDQQDPPELPHIKEETSQEEQLQGLEEEDIKFTLIPVPVKSEDDDEEKPQSSQLHQSQTEQMKSEADGEDCGGPEPDRNFNPDLQHLQPDTHDSETDNSCDWEETSEPQSGLDLKKNNSGCNSGKKSFSCSECGKQFHQSSNLKRHMRIHTGEKPFSCSVCNRRFLQKVNMTHHMALHKGEKRYSCNVCGKKFSWLYRLKNHQCVGCESSELQCQTEENRAAEHLETEAAGEDCGGSEPVRNLNPESHLQPDTHGKMSHSSEPEAGDSCDLQETSEPQSGLSSLQKDEVPASECNIRTTSTSSSECATGQTGQMQKHNGPQTAKPLSCSVCGKRYYWKKRLMTHMRLHSEGKLFSCPGCKERFSDRSTLSKHMRSHTVEKPFSCSVCGKLFIYRSSWSRHRRVHTGEKPYSCSVCKASFSHKSTWSKHMIIHSGEKSFSCSECGKAFALKLYLKQHIETHTGEKPFNCSVCGNRFTHRSSLARHLRIHTGEKPFSCSVCKANFRERGTLSKHTALHSGEKPFSCSDCGKKFALKTYLKEHMRIHSGEKPSSCFVCGMKCT